MTSREGWECPNCRFTNPPGTPACLNCDRPLTGQVPMPLGNDLPTPWADMPPVPPPPGSERPAPDVRPPSGLVRGRVVVIQPPTFEQVQTGSVAMLVLLLLGVSIAASYKLWLVFLLPLVLVFVVLMILGRGRVPGVGLAKALAFGLMAKGRRQRDEFPMQFFRLDTGEGVIQCIMEGDTKGGALHQGDEVEVSGRWDSRDRVFKARDIHNLATGAVVRVRLPFRETANRYARYVLRTVLAGATIWVIIYLIQR